MKQVALWPKTAVIEKNVLSSFYNSFSPGKSELEHIPAQSPAISNTEEWTSVESHDHPTYSTMVDSGGLIMLTDWGRHKFFKSDNHYIFIQVFLAMFLGFQLTRHQHWFTYVNICVRWCHYSHQSILLFIVLKQLLLTLMQNHDTPNMHGRNYVPFQFFTPQKRKATEFH